METLASEERVSQMSLNITEHTNISVSLYMNTLICLFLFHLSTLGEYTWNTNEKSIDRLWKSS